MRRQGATLGPPAFSLALLITILAWLNLGVFAIALGVRRRRQRLHGG